MNGGRIGHIYRFQPYTPNAPYCCYTAGYLASVRSVRQAHLIYQPT